MQRRRIQRTTAVGLAAALATFVAACSSSGGSGSSSVQLGQRVHVSSALSGTLNSSGSTLQLTYEQAAIQSFKQVQPGMTVNYGGGGSGKGRTDLASGVVNFAGSDSPIPSEETANFKGKKVLYFPILVGPITVSYNLSGVKNLKLTAAGHRGHLPGQDHEVERPGRSSRSTPASTCPAPRSPSPSARTRRAPRRTSPCSSRRPPATGSSAATRPSTGRKSAHAGNGNGGVAQIVKSTPGAIGYVDYADAKASGLSFASVKNKAGNYVAPSLLQPRPQPRPGSASRRT